MACAPCCSIARKPSTTAAAPSASRGRACTSWSGSARSRRSSTRRSAGALAAATTAASRSFGWKCRIPRAKNTCRCTICSSSTSRNSCMMRSRACRPHRHALAERGRRHRKPPRRRLARHRHARRQLPASRPTMCSPPTARARRSARMLGLRLKGENYEGRYVIADIRMDHDFPTERRAFFDPSGNPGGTVLIHKQPEDIWRVDYQLREGESEEDALREENIRARVSAILADIGHNKAVGAGMVEHLFRQHAVPRRLPPWSRVLHRRCRAYRADLRRARPQQRAGGCRQYRLEARPRAQRRGR